MVTVKDRLKIGDLYWKPGRRTKKPWFHQLGEFGVSFIHDQQPTEWQPVTHAPVFAFCDTGTTDIDWVDLTVGTADPIAFLLNEVWATFQPSDDFSDYDTQREQFEESIDRLIRELKGRCVPRTFTYRDLEAFLKQSEDVAQVTYSYPRGTFKKDGTLNSHRTNPCGISLHTSTGRSVKLSFY